MCDETLGYLLIGLVIVVVIGVYLIYTQVEK